MIKSELVKKVVEAFPNLPEKKIAELVSYILETMSESLIRGQRIEVRDFGSFSLRELAARNAHNPKTGEKLLTSSKRSAHFKPGKELKERVDESRLKHPIEED